MYINPHEFIFCGKTNKLFFLIITGPEQPLTVLCDFEVSIWKAFLAVAYWAVVRNNFILR